MLKITRSKKIPQCHSAQKRPNFNQFVYKMATKFQFSEKHNLYFFLENFENRSRYS